MAKKLRFNRYEKYNHTTPYLSKVLFKLDKLIDNWEQARTTDTAHFLARPLKAIWINMVIGISRGVGFVIGVSVVGAVFIGLMGWLLSKFVSLPIIGKYIAIIVELVQHYLKENSIQP